MDTFGYSPVPCAREAAANIVGFMVVEYKGPRVGKDFNEYDHAGRCQLNTMASKQELKELHVHGETMRAHVAAAESRMFTFYVQELFSVQATMSYQTGPQWRAGRSPSPRKRLVRRPWLPKQRRSAPI